MSARFEFRRGPGYTLPEVLVCVLIIGVLAAIATPQYFKVIERDKATEAVNLLLAVSGGQDRFSAKYGAFCLNTIANCPGFDVTPSPLKYFAVPPAFTTGSGGGSWSLTLTRAAPLPTMWGAYALSYDSGRTPRLACVSAVGGAPDCTSALLPAP